MRYSQRICRPYRGYSAAGNVLPSDESLGYYLCPYRG
jgi:hypothetical protein